MAHKHSGLWLIPETNIRHLVAKVAAAGKCPTARELAAENRRRMKAAKELAAKSIRAVKGKIGVLPIMGPVDQRLSGELLKAGGTSTEEISAGLDALLADSSVDAILLQVDSPGGSSYGVEELSDKIFAARERKPIYAIADSMAASAAYWIASAAEFLAVTPGGDVGSVGVYTLHVDESVLLESEGVKVTAISAGKHKVEMGSWNPLADESKSELQKQVNWTYGKFVSALARNRDTKASTVRSDFGEGRVVNADDALAAGMVDRVMTFDELLGKLTGASGGKRKAEVFTPEKTAAVDDGLDLLGLEVAIRERGIE